MIVFDRSGARFNYRVGGVALRAGKVLLQSAENMGFWVLPGGRVEMLESAEIALARELREELAVEARIKRLLWLNENFFPLDGLAYHEIGLYFLVDLPDSVPFDSDFYARDAGVQLVFRWFALDDLPNVEPSFLGGGLRDLPDVPRHVIQRDL
ncbi:MAG TPA: NUDIX domain-containing protein [Chloroflexota bacterium]